LIFGRSYSSMPFSQRFRQKGRNSSLRIAKRTLSKLLGDTNSRTRPSNLLLFVHSIALNPNLATAGSPDNGVLGRNNTSRGSLPANNLRDSLFLYAQGNAGMANRYSTSLRSTNGYQTSTVACVTPGSLISNNLV